MFFPEEKKIFTYEKFYQEYNKISQILISKKINKGEKISIIFYNESKFLISTPSCKTNIFFLLILNFLLNAFEIKITFFTYFELIKFKFINKNFVIDLSSE